MTWNTGRRLYLNGIEMRWYSCTADTAPRCGYNGVVITGEGEFITAALFLHLVESE